MSLLGEDHDESVKFREGMKIMKTITQMDDLRKGKNDTVVISPVGSESELNTFVVDVKKKNITNVDYLFVCKKGLEVDLTKLGLSAIYYEENFPLGTSGAFFEAQVAAYNLGYKYIVVTDLDCELESIYTFHQTLQLAKDTGKIAVPLSKARTTEGEAKFFNVNQWGVFPRQMFEKYGFCTPYFKYGSEDYDLICRVKKDIVVNKEGRVFHPMTGYTAYHKMVNKAKFYPYLGSLMKDFLLLKKYPQYIAWYMYYGLFADVFNDKQLNDLVNTSNNLGDVRKYINDNKWVEITEIKKTGIHAGKFEVITTILKSLPQFVLGKSFDVYTSRINLTMPKMQLLRGMIKAGVFMPFRGLGALWNILMWHLKYKKGIVYPVYVENVSSAEAWMLKNFKG
jgi:hypothetical protein